MKKVHVLRLHFFANIVAKEPGFAKLSLTYLNIEAQQS